MGQSLESSSKSLPLIIVEDIQHEGEASGPEVGDMLGDAVRIALYQYRSIVSAPSRSTLWESIKDKRIEVDLGSTQKAIFQDQVYRRIGASYIVRGSYRERNDAWIATLSLVSWSIAKERQSVTSLGEYEIHTSDIQAKARLVAQRIIDALYSLSAKPQRAENAVTLVMGCFQSLSPKYKKGQEVFSKDLGKDLERDLKSYSESSPYLSLVVGSALKQDCPISGPHSKQMKAEPNIDFPHISIYGSYEVNEKKRVVKIFPQVHVWPSQQSQGILVNLKPLFTAYEPYSQVKEQTTAALAQFVRSVVSPTGRLSIEYLSRLSPTTSTGDILQYIEQIIKKEGTNTQSTASTGIQVSQQRSLRIHSWMIAEVLLGEVFKRLDDLKQPSMQDTLFLARAHHYEGLIKREAPTPNQAGSSVNLLFHFRQANKLYSVLAGKTKLALEDQRGQLESRLNEAEWLSRAAATRNEAIALFRDTHSEMNLDSALHDSNLATLYLDSVFLNRSIRSITELANAYLSAEVYSEAENTITKLTNSRFSGAEAVNLLAKVYSKQGKFNESFNQYNHVLDEFCRSTCRPDDRNQSIIGLRETAFLIAREILGADNTSGDEGRTRITKGIDVISILEQHDKSPEVYYARGSLNQILSEINGEHRKPTTPLNGDLYKSILDLATGLAKERKIGDSWSGRYYRYSLDFIEQLIILGRPAEAYERALPIIENLQSETEVEQTWELPVAQYLLIISSLLSKKDLPIMYESLVDRPSTQYEKVQSVWSFKVLNEFIQCSSSVASDTELRARLQRITNHFISLLGYGELDHNDEKLATCLS